MRPAVADLSALLATLEPELHAGTYAFATVPAGRAVDLGAAVATVREREGLAVVMPLGEIRSAGLEPAFACEWLTLTVHSDLAAVGLTAAVAGALAQAGIACNVVAGAHHDHLFVPAGSGAAALEALRSLQRGTMVPVT